MKRFVEGTDRKQSTLFADCLDDWIDENNPRDHDRRVRRRLPPLGTRRGWRPPAFRE